MSAGQNNRRDFEVTEATLHGYADGQLDAAGQLAVEAWLAAHPDRAADVENWRRQNAAIAALFRPVASEPVPARLNPHRIAALADSTRWEWTRLAAAAVLLVGLSGGVGWFMRGALWQEEAASDRLIDGAVAAHSLYVRESRHAVEVAADDKAHLLTWLSSRLGRAITAPDLAAQGFELVGGRLLPPLAEAGTGPAAQLMYQNATSSRVTVYITAALGDHGRPYEMAAQKGLEAYYWANDQITCTVVGDLPESDMQLVAKGVYQQLTWRPDPPGRT